MQAGKGAGYAQWAKVFNLKQMAQPLFFLEENGLLEYDALAARAAEGTAWFNELSGTIKRAEGCMAEIAALLAEKKKAHAGYAATKKEMQDVLTAMANVDRLLSTGPESRNQKKKGL